MTRRAASLGLIAVALVLSGCGLGAGRKITGSKAVEVHVTRDYGRGAIDSATVRSFPAGETVMKLLQREFEVTTRFGGGFVQSIEGLPGGSDDGRKVDWFYYVNGIEAAKGAAETKVTAGDRIWWDRHDWGVAMDVPAVVGSFPEPFIHGTDSKRAPLVLQCGGEERTCDEVAERLDKAGVVGVSRSAGTGTGQGAKLQRVLVGPWSSIRTDPAARLLETGPQKSGVFARPVDGGAGLQLLDARGEVRDTLGAGGGLVAATRFGAQQPTWVVTGVDDAGVAAAAAAFSESTLEDEFAIAVDDGKAVGLPYAPDLQR